MANYHTHYRNRDQAVRAWRRSVRDLAVLALYESQRPLPLVVLAAKIQVDASGLRWLLEPDPRFTIEIRQFDRPCGRHRLAPYVRLASAPGQPTGKPPKICVNASTAQA